MHLFTILYYFVLLLFCIINFMSRDSQTITPNKKPLINNFRVILLVIQQNFSQGVSEKLPYIYLPGAGVVLGSFPNSAVNKASQFTYILSPIIHINSHKIKCLNTPSGQIIFYNNNSNLYKQVFFFLSILRDQLHCLVKLITNHSCTWKIQFCLIKPLY